MEQKYIDAFWDSVDIRSDDECWEWKLSKSNGYGVVSIANGEQGRAHRISYELANGVITESGLFVCHTCDNPPCVNPRHLFLGTPKDNALDMIAKGRRYQPNSRGENCGTHLLSDSQVLEICKKLDAGLLLEDIAVEFGVKEGTVSNINTGKSWKWLTGRDISNKVITKGRPKAKTRGSLSSVSKLIESDVLEICSRIDNGESKASIARAFGVHSSTINLIDKGRNWGWLTKRAG